MAEPAYLKVRNNCREKITVYLRYPRPKRQSVKRPSSFTLRPRESSHPLPRHFLDGARGWASLTKKDCVTIEIVPFKSRFVQVTNLSPRTLELLVRPAPKRVPEREALLKVKPGKKSRPVDVRSIAQRRRLSKLVELGEAAISPIYEIGPSTGRGGAVASYADEDVYVCYDCGGPIVFRGSPPSPVHI